MLEKVIENWTSRLDYIRASRGSVIAFPFITPYTISKYAAVGLAESLKRELDMWGIKVVSIEPELFQTGMSAPENVDRELGTSCKKFEKFLKYHFEDPIKYFTRVKRIVLCLASPKVNAVVDDLESAVSLAYPDNTYKCRRNGFARFIVFCFEVLPRTWQLNISKVIVRLLFPLPVKSE
ncbi:estradiol 17-beta-dehydrogenase 2 [Trichonephila clavipes]|nr:estradiol 17-beta-dehydrogenase 2 [Trichonephila clavipes]